MMQNLAFTQSGIGNQEVLRQQVHDQISIYKGHHGFHRRIDWR